MKGWHLESARHSLARHGIKTGRKTTTNTAIGGKKTLNDFKNALSVGSKWKLLEKFGTKIDSLREVVEAHPEYIKFKALDESKAGRLDFPKATLLDFDGKKAIIYGAGYRDLTAEEKRIIEAEPKPTQQEAESDMIADTNYGYWAKKRYYQTTAKDYYYLSGWKEQKGKYKTRQDDKEVIRDDDIKGKVALVYEKVK
jgi:hypothetical protein